MSSKLYSMTNFQLRVGEKLKETKLWDLLWSERRWSCLGSKRFYFYHVFWKQCVIIMASCLFTSHASWGRNLTLHYHCARTCTHGCTLLLEKKHCFTFTCTRKRRQWWNLSVILRAQPYKNWQMSITPSKQTIIPISGQIIVCDTKSSHW